jgi:UPF0755 protein
MKRKQAKKVNAVTGTVIRGTLSLIFYGVVIALVLSAIRWGYQFGYNVFNGKPKTNGPEIAIQYTVEEEQSIRSIAEDLKKKGLIEDSWVMIVQKVFYEYNIIPGTYELNSGMTSREILEWMTKLSNSIAEETEAETTEAETTEETAEGDSEDGGEDPSAEGGAE